jgi:hypothetical protein
MLAFFFYQHQPDPSWLLNTVVGSTRGKSVVGSKTASEYEQFMTSNRFFSDEGSRIGTTFEQHLKATAVRIRINVFE